MNKKQQIPSQQQPPKEQQAMQQKGNAKPGGERAVEGEELHGQSGHRVPDQGSHKRG